MSEMQVKLIKDSSAGINVGHMIFSKLYTSLWYVTKCQTNYDVALKLNECSSGQYVLKLALAIYLVLGSYNLHIENI